MGHGQDLDFGVETVGGGSEVPLLLIHGAFTSQACRPLSRQSALTNNRAVIHYHRRGYGRTPPPPSGFSIADQTADARAVLASVGVRRAHVLGHSIGTMIALQLALDAPDLVESLVLVDPTFVTRPERLQEFEAGMRDAFKAYSAGDRARTVHEMYRVLDGETYRDVLDPALGAVWFDEAISMLDLYFQVELPAAVEWRLGAEDAARLACPMLVMCGERGPVVFRRIFDDVLSLVARARGMVVPEASHNIIACRPSASATTIDSFLSTRAKTHAEPVTW